MLVRFAAGSRASWKNPLVFEILLIGVGLRSDRRNIPAVRCTIQHRHRLPHPVCPTNSHITCCICVVISPSLATTLRVFYPSQETGRGSILTVSSPLKRHEFLYD